jgi:hypothetical protein
MHIFYNTSNCNGVKRMLRPLIVIEGYEEPGVTQSTYQRMFALLDAKVLGSPPINNLTDFLYPAEYDLIYVDLNNGSDYIQRNAYVVEEVIKKVNELKALAGSTEQNVVLGVSMGGIAGKYALLDMQNSGLAHDTRLYITYDSPLSGANIPIATQCFMKFMVDNLGTYAGDDISIPSVDAVWAALQAPTPRQLLLYHVNHLGVDNPEQIAFFAEMNGLGTLGMRHVALSNGSGLGTLVENNITAGLPFMELKGQKIVCETTQSGIILCGDVNFNITLRATGNNILTEVFHGFIEKNEPLGSISTESTVNWSTKPYDVSPGGTSNLGVAPLGTVPGGLMSSLIAAGVTTSGGLTATHHCFIPSFSSVFATTPTNFTSPQTCGAVSRCTQSATATVTSYGGIPEINQPHIALDARIANLLIDELVTMSPPPPVNVLNLLPNNTLNQYFNVGLDIHSSIPTLSVASSNGKLQINNTGLIAFATGNEPTSAQNSFTAFLKCEATLSVEDNAQLKIGADGGSKHGKLIAPNGSTVHVKSGGTLHITSGESMLIIQSGATLTLDENSRIMLDNPESKIRIEGSLILNGNFKFSGLGYFEFVAGHTLKFGDNLQSFQLIGDNSRFIRLDDNVVLDIPAGRHLELIQGNVEYASGASINFTEASDGVFRFVDFYAKESTGSTGITAYGGMGNLEFYSCDFRNIMQPMMINGGKGKTFATKSNFNLYQLGSVFNFRTYLDFNDCTWDGSGLDDDGNPGGATLSPYGFRSYFNGVTRLRRCTIVNHVNEEADIVDMNINTLHSKGYAAIEVEGGWLLWMQGGELNKNDFGIVNREFQDGGGGLPTNILLQDKATIKNGHSGIVMKGNKYTGLVMMDCGKLIDLTYGIVGEDIRLSIDPSLLIFNDGTKARPNTFVMNNDVYKLHATQSYYGTDEFLGKNNHSKRFDTN